jgi:hypothetical protein
MVWQTKKSVGYIGLVHWPGWMWEPGRRLLGGLKDG